MSIVLSSLRWPSLARDLAIMTAPGSPLTDLGQLCKAYGVTDKELAEITKIPAFQDLLKRELEACKAQGSKAGVHYRFSSLSQALAEQLFRDASNGILEGKDVVALLKLFMQAGGLLSDKEAPQVNTQVNVGVQLPLPVGISGSKLKHLVPVEA